MAIEDDENCGSTEDKPYAFFGQHQSKKAEVYNEVLRRLKESGHPEAQLPGFSDQLRDHFNNLPSRYVVDVNLGRAEDALIHMRLLQLARVSKNRHALDVRLVQVVPACDEDSEGSDHPTSFRRVRGSAYPPPFFGSSPNLEALSLEAGTIERVEEDDGVVNASNKSLGPLHEIAFCAKDKPKLLSQVTSLLAEIGLNVQEAHAFSTKDGFSLDIFVVLGWPHEEVENLRNVLETRVLKVETKHSDSNQILVSPIIKEEKTETKVMSDHVTIPNDGTDVWEIDPHLLEFQCRVASGTYGDLYKGSYRGQEVAIKVLKAECVNEEVQKEFAQEVYIMRKVRHKNVVQFIGACTRHPNLCILTEFMSGGSVYDYLHKKRNRFSTAALLKVAIDVSKGMDYLHQSNIIHRDLKTANLLMDENEVVKVGDFGVARVRAQTGVMTAETGTYRWMAPEVLEHKPYDQKADVFSFGIVLWELLTGKIPYDLLTPFQAAVGVVQDDLRPTIPKETHPKLTELIERCWQKNPTLRPEFCEITEILKKLTKEAREVERKKAKSGGLFAALKRGAGHK